MTTRPRPALLLAGGALLLLSSCATTALWSDSNQDVYDEDDESYNFEPRVNGAGDLIFKIALTPFALAFDICTSPLQALLIEGDPDPLINALGGDTDSDCD